jgi:hypothetical protein
MRQDASSLNESQEASGVCISIAPARPYLATRRGAGHDHPMPLFPSDDVAGGGDKPRDLRHRGACTATVEHVGRRLGGAAPP